MKFRINLRVNRKMAHISIILAGGSNDRGGIDRVTEYMCHEFSQISPETQVQVHYSRVGFGGAKLHFSVIPSLLSLTGKLMKGEVDVVHLNVAPRGSTFRKMLFLLPAKLLGARVVVQLHGSGYNEFYARLRVPAKLIVRRFFHAADLVVVLGDFWAAFVSGELGVDPHKVLEVSNGVPDPGMLATPGMTPPRIVFAGAVGERKGVDVLLRTLARLRDSGTPFACDILGDGEVEKYQALSVELGLSEAVVFHGWQDMDAVRSVMAKSSIFVLPSRAENQPVAILEAMAVGLPVIASKIGAIPEQVADGESGLLVEPGNAESLYTALAELTQFADKRIRFGTKGRKRWQERFSIEANARLLLQAYRSLR